MINSIGKPCDNPQEGDLLHNYQGKLVRFYKGKFIPIVMSDNIEVSEEQARLKSMYASGIRHYMNSGLRMTLRSDGTEYIDKQDLPA